MKIIKQDILEIPHGIIAHGCNNCGVMGAGLADSIAKKWPIVYERYKQYPFSPDFLGEVRFVKVSKEGLDPPYLFVANCITQYYYGKHKPYRGDCHFDYESFPNVLDRLIIAARSGKKESQVYLPFMMGAGLAGGDWSRIVYLIEEIERREKYEFIACDNRDNH